MLSGVSKWWTIKKYWFPHHKHPSGCFDGIYVLYKPKDHVEWKAYKKVWMQRMEEQYGPAWKKTALLAGTFPAQFSDLIFCEQRPDR